VDSLIICLEKCFSPLSLQPPNEEAAMLMDGQEFIKLLYGKWLVIIFEIILDVVWKLRKGDYLCSR